jgi:hypothetical protein
MPVLLGFSKAAVRSLGVDRKLGLHLEVPHVLLVRCLDASDAKVLGEQGRRRN